MKNILICTDFSDVTERVMAEATKLAHNFGAQARIIHVIAPEHDVVMYSPGGVPAMATHVAPDVTLARKRIQNLAEQMSRADVRVSAEVLEVEDIETAILEEAHKIDADAIVMGSHGHGALFELLVGSVTEHVMRHSRCPVIVVPSRKK